MYFLLWIWAAFAALFPGTQAGSSTTFGSIGTTTFGTNNSVLRTSISNPPINLCDQDFIEDFIDFLNSLNTTLDGNGDPAVKVVIIASALPNYFIDTFDIRLFQAPGPVNNYVNGTVVLERYWVILELLNTLPQLFIAEVDGIAYAAGNELIMNMDMRFAGPGASMGAPEAVCGVLHVGGIQQLTALVGPAYANQYMISALPISGPHAAEIGWVNEYYDSSAGLTAAINTLATRIALFPWTAITSNKNAIKLSGPTQDMINAGKTEFFSLVTQSFVQECVLNWLALDGGNITDTMFQRNLLSLLPEVWTGNFTS